MPVWLRRLAWFIGLWAVSVLTLGFVALGVRAELGTG